MKPSSERSPILPGPPSRNSRREEPWQPRFGIRELLMIMLICSVLAASLGYLYQDQKAGGRSMRFIFITVAGPTLMAVCLGIGFVTYEFLQRKKRKKKPEPKDIF